jgi:hypothetical protein
MFSENNEYQKCVESIGVEQGWRYYNHQNPQAVVITFRRTSRTPAFKYAPRYSELRKVIRLLKERDGEEEIEKELKIKIRG